MDPTMVEAYLQVLSLLVVAVVVLRFVKSDNDKK